MSQRIVLSALLIAALAHLGCGGGAVCGDGVPEGAEECDDGNRVDDDACTNACKQHETRDAQIIWTLMTKEFPGFNETCTGVGAAHVKLEITGPSPMTLNQDCDGGQYFQRALAAGHYTIAATLLDADMNPLTKGMTKVEFDMPTAPTGTPVQVLIDFPMADFLKSYKGNFLYLLKWGGKSTCPTALPPVVKRTIRMERGGQPITTTDGVLLDGNTPGDCVDSSSGLAINNVPWGPVDLTIVGLDATSTPQFSQTFHSFSGAGIVNPVFTFDVSSLHPDAGVPPPADAAASDPQ